MTSNPTPRTRPEPQRGQRPHENQQGRRRLLTRGAALAAGTALAATGGVLVPALAAPATPATTPAQQTQQSTQTAQSAQGGEDPGQAWEEQAFRGSVDVVPGSGAASETVSGVVFDDLDQDSRQDRDEPGIEGVEVSNGREIVTTDADGAYEIPAFDNMTVFVSQPSGYQVPVDGDNVAQFFYTHSPEGSPDLRYGGIDPTGPLPEAINFPLAQDEGAAGSTQECLIGGDIQTYDTAEVEYARAGAFADLAARSGYEDCGALFIGDVVGDDLSLYPDIEDLASMLNGPARFLPGNHDIDFDATTLDHAFDTYRSYFGPEYYSYDVGQAHFVALNNVEYPYAGDTTYNGSIDEEQMEWLRQDIANTPEDRLIVLSAHIPLLGFADQNGTQHQTDQVAEIHELLEGREAISLAGHVHAIENLRAGDSLQAWEELFGVTELPFPHITAGAVSGDWYSGEMTEAGYPTALQRDGARPGMLTLDIEGNQVTERFTATGDDGTDQMAVGLNTPAYREWFEANREAEGSAEELTAPLSVPAEDLASTWLTANVFMGATGASVEVSVDGGEAVPAERTQPMEGEEQFTGAEYSDPVAVQEQLVHGGSVADRTSHLWRLPLPEDLAAGEHTAEVTTTDPHGRSFTETLDFTVVASEGEEPGGPTEGEVPVEAEVPGLGDGGSGEDGSLALSLTPGSAVLEAAEDAGDRISMSGALPEVSVTDTRSDAAGWELSGQAGALSAGEAEITASSLGWTPEVLDSSRGAVPGEPIATRLSGGPGLAEPAVLGSADAATRMGTSVFGAELLLEVPVDTEEGSYSGALSMSLFPVD